MDITQPNTQGRSWFLITSAVAQTQDGLDQATRVDQTCDTIRSIRQCMPHAEIVLLETSLAAVEPQHRDVLQNLTDRILWYGQDPMVQMLHARAGDLVSLIKSPNESLILHRALTDLRDMQDQDRVFKISGRYRLTAKFDPQQHQDAGTVTVLQRSPAVTYYSQTTGQSFAPEAPWQYKTRLYSFCASLREIMRSRYLEIFTYITGLYQMSRFNDIEHSVFMAWQDLRIREIPVIGVAGMQVPSKKWVEE